MFYKSKHKINKLSGLILFVIELKNSLEILTFLLKFENITIKLQEVLILKLNQIILNVSDIIH